MKKVMGCCPQIKNVKLLSNNLIGPTRILQKLTPQKMKKKKV